MHAPNVAADGLALPLSDGSASRIYAGHVFEHLTWEDALRAVRECWRVLRDGGLLLVVGPDVERASIMGRSGQLSLAEFDAAVFGPGSGHDAHRWVPVAWRWELLCVQAGFNRAASLPLADFADTWPIVSFAPWQCAVLCVRER